ncbi:MAG TPA: hypothetical protein VFE15_09805 [Marmoricola sp.]|jgi:hypothetical protein|nr:hypothetical protein [Marmoricola sp.]
MNQILSFVATVIVLPAGLAVLIAWVRRDGFSAANAGATRPSERDAALPEPTPVDRFLAQRAVTAVAADRRPATYESHPTTATA